MDETLMAALPSEAEMRPNLAKAGARYAEAKRSAEESSVTWKWATGPYFHLTPLRPERWGGSGARLLGSEPSSKAGKFEFGFDDGGRLRVIRAWSSDRPQASETFFSYDGNSAAAVVFGPDKAALSVSSYVLRGGLPVASVMLGEQLIRETYGYERGEISRIRIERGGSEQEYEVLRDPATHAVTLRSARSVAPHAPAKLSVPQLFSALKAYLVKAVPEAVKKHAPQSEALCLALLYEGSTYECLPPQLSVGTVAELQKARETHPDAPAGWWRAVTFDWCGAIPYGEDELESLCAAMINEMKRADSNDLARDVLVATAAALNKQAWDGVLKIAPEFVVYACDTEPGETLKMLEASIPPARWKALERAGWLSAKHTVNPKGPRARRGQAKKS